MQLIDLEETKINRDLDTSGGEQPENLLDLATDQEAPERLVNTYEVSKDNDQMVSVNLIGIPSLDDHQIILADEVPKEEDEVLMVLGKNYLRKCHIYGWVGWSQKELDVHKLVQVKMDRTFRYQHCDQIFFDLWNLNRVNVLPCFFSSVTQTTKANILDFD